MESGTFARRAVFHLPSSIFHLRFLFFLALAVFISGCSPSGPRALFAGKKLLDRGDYPGAVERLKTAATLLATNAAAWNYYGVALQHAGQPSDAAQAYQNALKFDRDLMEAHYNLGCLWLEQGQPDAARTEFIAYTLRRNNTPEGWLKLGSAQLKLRDYLTAERSFSTALSLNPNNAEALNGLGLARVARDRPQDAAQFFSAAVEAHHDYAPALLNLATVQREYLRDNTEALKNYRAYLEMTPRPADWDAVNDLVNNFDQPVTVAAVTENETPASTKPNTGGLKSQSSTATSHMASSPKMQSGVKNTQSPSRPVPSEVVAVQPETMIVTTPAAPVSASPVQPAPAAKPSMWDRLNPAHWFGSPTQADNYTQNGVTPLTADNSTTTAAPPSPPPPAAAPAPEKMVPPAPPSFPRYLYLSPHKPKAGDRKAASRAFADAQQSEKDQDLQAAMDSYRKAASLDPAWFEAQYNYAVLAWRQHEFSHSLAASELALALRPSDTDARYNFALALKSAGYETDAVNELNKIVASNPDEARAQLALGNLYSLQMRDPERARQHYMKWLDLDPHNPQATNIRFWLSANPQ